MHDFIIKRITDVMILIWMFSASAIESENVWIYVALAVSSLWIFSFAYANDHTMIKRRQND